MAGSTEVRDEAQMIAKILAGDSQLFHELIRPYERRVYAMALSFLHNEADAEDAAQEAFLKAFRNLSSFRGEAKFGTWLVSITLNEARSRIRSRDTIKMESLDEPTDDQGSYVAGSLTRLEGDTVRGPGAQGDQAPIAKSHHRSAADLPRSLPTERH